MSETQDMQEKVRKASKSPLKDTNTAFIVPLMLFCGFAGDAVQRILNGFNPETVPESLKLDLYEFAVVAARLKAKAGMVAKNDKDGELSEAILAPGFDAGDIGNKAKNDLANVLKAYSELSAELRINLRELLFIAEK